MNESGYSDPARDLERRWKQERSSQLTLQLAEEHRRHGDLDRAIEVLREGLEHHPTHMSARVALGRYLLEGGGASAAKAALESVVDDDPTHLVASKLLVSAELALGDADGARRRLDLYSALNPGDSELESLQEQIAAASSESSRAKTVIVEPSINPGDSELESLQEQIAATASEASHAKTIIVEPSIIEPPDVDAPSEEALASEQEASSKEEAAPESDAVAEAADAAAQPADVEGHAVEELAESEPADVEEPADEETEPELDVAEEAAGEEPERESVAVEEAASMHDDGPFGRLAVDFDQKEYAAALASEGIFQIAAPPQPAPEIDVLAPEDEAPVEIAEEATVTLGQLYLEQGHLGDAERIFRTVLQSDPGNEEARAGLRESLGEGAGLRATDLVDEATLEAAAPIERKRLVLEGYRERLRAAGNRS